MILTNLIPVPSMTSGWSVSGTTAVTGYGGGSSIKLTGTTSTPEVVTNTAASIALIPSHIYYARVYGYQTTKAGGSVGFYWPIAEPNFQEGISLKDAGSWQMYSGRNNRTSFSSGNYQFRLDYNNNYIAGTMYFSAPMLIDLTAAFGLGNEPTKEWMDSNIPYFVGSYGKLQAGDILNYDYTGAVQTVTLPKGVYKLEVWGAEGGGSRLSGNSDSGLGGLGGYSTGTITIEKNTAIYVYVGGAGGSSTNGNAAGGFNGGGQGYASGFSEPGNGGGGASDIRIGADSLYNRVIVAGGGGGGGEDPSDAYGHGGGTTGVAGTGSPSNGIQTAAGTNGGFGVGAGTNKGDGGGGGGGWYGGGTSQSSSGGSDTQGGGGGSGYVLTASSSKPSGYALGSQYYLTNANTIAGNASMPSVSGGTETGHTGNGYARITVISTDSFNGYIKTSSGWKEISDLFVKVSINGTSIWKNAGSIKIRDTSIWKNS